MRSTREGAKGNLSGLGPVEADDRPRWKDRPPKARGAKRERTLHSPTRARSYRTLRRPRDGREEPSATRETGASPDIANLC